MPTPAVIRALGLCGLNRRTPPPNLVDLNDKHGVLRTYSKPLPPGLKCEFISTHVCMDRSVSSYLIAHRLPFHPAAHRHLLFLHLPPFRQGWLHRPTNHTKYQNWPSVIHIFFYIPCISLETLFRRLSSTYDPILLKENRQHGFCELMTFYSVFQHI